MEKKIKREAEHEANLWHNLLCRSALDERKGCKRVLKTERKRRWQDENRGELEFHRRTRLNQTLKSSTIECVSHLTEPYEFYKKKEKRFQLNQKRSTNQKIFAIHWAILSFQFLISSLHFLWKLFCSLDENQSPSYSLKFNSHWRLN